MSTSREIRSAGANALGWSTATRAATLPLTRAFSPRSAPSNPFVAQEIKKNFQTMLSTMAGRPPRVMKMGLSPPSRPRILRSVGGIKIVLGLKGEPRARS